MLALQLFINILVNTPTSPSLKTNIPLPPFNCYFTFTLQELKKSTLYYVRCVEIDTLKLLINTYIHLVWLYLWLFFWCVLQSLFFYSEFLSLGLIPRTCVDVFKELRRLASSTRRVARFVFLLLARLVVGAEFPT